MNRPTDDPGRRPPLVLVGHEPGDHPSPLPPHGVRGEEAAGQDRGTPPGHDPAAAQPAAQEAGLRAELQERTADLQRLKAEYDNYRKRVHRDRMALGEIAVSNVLGRLLPVLDALAEATEQGEVTGGFGRVAQALDSELAGLGLQSFGTAGDPFDPVVHEAVLYTPTDEVDRTTCAAILRPGYRVGTHLLRPAEVAVAGPPDDGPVKAAEAECTTTVTALTAVTTKKTSAASATSRWTGPRDS
ncbi:nucleotide exchange factor GrpE [Streptomyces inhibens]|uniref:nucleotide exchange factor GrpE n=1 Tax=Streptomyces inhibens TaxID=2293571 RepID=UPI0037A914B0